MQDKGLSAAQLASEFRAEWGEDLHWLLDSELVQQELVAQACVVGCPKLVASVAVATLAKLVGLGVDAAGTAMVTSASAKLGNALARCRFGRLVLPRLHKVLTDARDNAEFRRRLRLVADGKLAPGEVEAPEAAPEELAALLGLKRDLDGLGLYLAGEFDTVNDKLDELLRRVTPSRPRLCTLPASTADFTGREGELAHLASILAAGGRAAISAVTGMGGVGKTALAVEAAWRAAESFPDGILFLDLGGFGPSPLTPEAALANLIAQVEPTLKAPEGLAQLGAAYRGLLANRRMLLLLDNARDPAQLRPLLPPEPVALLATSRVPLRLPGVQPLQLDALPEAEALALLRSALHRRPADDADLDRIAAACARLPIALRAAGAFLAEHPGWTIPDYLAALAGKRLPHFASEDDPALDVATVLGFSIERLAAERPALALRWRLLAVFPGDFAADAAAAAWGAEPRDAADDLGRLSARSLLLHDAASGRWRLHDLYRELAEMGADEEAVETARERHAEHFLEVLWQIDALYKMRDKTIEGLALFDLERPSIEAGQSWAASRMARHGPAARLAYAYTNAGAYVLSLRLPPPRRIGWLEAAVVGCRQTGDRRGEGAALGNLGIAWAALGETRKAIGLYEQQLAIAGETGDRRGEGNALGSLGLAWADLGETRKAIGLYEQQLAIAGEIGDRRGEGNALNNLGLAWAALGETRKAIGLYEQQLAIAREIGDRRGEGAALGNLGIAWAALGETRKAIGLYEQLLAIAREIGDRRGEGNALGNLGIAWADLGETRKAIGLYEQRLAIAREIGDRLGEGAALGNLGNAWAALGEPRKAIELYEQQLAITREIGDRRGEGAALGNLGIAWADLGETRKAIELYEQQLAIAREIGDRRGEGNALFNSAGQYEKVGEREKAITNAKSSLTILRAIEDPNARIPESWLRERGIDPDKP